MAAKFQSFDKLQYESETSPDTYPSWEVDCKSALVLSGFWGYITGRNVTVPPKQIPDPSSTTTPPALIDNPRWEDFIDENLIVLSCIRLRIGATDQRVIKDDTLASESWAKLKAAHLPSGALSQLTILQEALTLRFSRETPLKQTSDKLQTLIDTFFAIRPPTQDEWTAILFLNAMAGAEFKDARSSLDTLLSAGTLSSAAVVTRIKHEQIRINAENAETTTKEASFAAFSKRYEAETGSRPENASKGRSQKKEKKGGGQKDDAKVAVDSDDESDEQAAFANDTSGYRSFFADSESSPHETTSVDWSKNARDEAHIAHDKLVLYLDTGATSSICPILAHFTKIEPCTRNISGVGGSSIKAIGIGEVRQRELRSKAAIWQDCSNGHTHQNRPLHVGLRDPNFCTVSIYCIHSGGSGITRSDITYDQQRNGKYSHQGRSDP
ncbi:hypothetical protein FB451DRAFT_1448774 [Mycena latifolia]|nr:hypothetical protein FB451DRAFT_1448774 [Mycena latifolia]